MSFIVELLCLVLGRALGFLIKPIYLPDSVAFGRGQGKETVKQGDKIVFWPNAFRFHNSRFLVSAEAEFITQQTPTSLLPSLLPQNSRNSSISSPKSGPHATTSHILSSREQLTWNVFMQAHSDILIQSYKVMPKFFRYQKIIATMNLF